MSLNHFRKKLVTEKKALVLQSKKKKGLTDDRNIKENNIINDSNPEADKKSPIVSLDFLEEIKMNTANI